MLALSNAVAATLLLPLAVRWTLTSNQGCILGTTLVPLGPRQSSRFGARRGRRNTQCGRRRRRHRRRRRRGCFPWMDSEHLVCGGLPSLQLNEHGSADPSGVVQGDDNGRETERPKFRQRIMTTYLPSTWTKQYTVRCQGPRPPTSPTRTSNRAYTLRVCRLHGPLMEPSMWFARHTQTLRVRGAADNPNVSLGDLSFNEPLWIIVSVTSSRLIPSFLFPFLLIAIGESPRKRGRRRGQGVAGIEREAGRYAKPSHPADSLLPAARGTATSVNHCQPGLCTEESLAVCCKRVISQEFWVQK